MPRVSAIMTVRNGEAYVANAIDSLLRQSLDDIEVIVNDNGSTDRTVEILSSYDDPRLTVLPAEPNRPKMFADGISRAFDHAQAPYIAVLDSDDIAMPERFEKQSAFLDAEPEFALVGSSYQWIDAEGRPEQKVRAQSDPTVLGQMYAWTNPLAHSSIMIRRDAAIRVGGYDRNFKFACDFGMAINLQAAGHKIAALPDFLVKIRRHPAQDTQSPALSVVRAHDTYVLTCRAQTLPAIDEPARDKGRHAVARASFLYAQALRRDGRTSEAEAVAHEAMRVAPFYYLLYSAYRIIRRR